MHVLSFWSRQCEQLQVRVGPYDFVRGRHWCVAGARHFSPASADATLANFQDRIFNTPTSGSRRSSARTPRRSSSRRHRSVPLPSTPRSSSSPPLAPLSPFLPPTPTSSRRPSSPSSPRRLSPTASASPVRAFRCRDVFARSGLTSLRSSDAISSAWETLIVKDQPTDVAMARLWLYVATKDVLASAMKLLTLEPLEKM